MSKVFYREPHCVVSDKIAVMMPEKTPVYILIEAPLKGLQLGDFPAALKNLLLHLPQHTVLWETSVLFSENSAEKLFIKSHESRGPVSF